MPKDSDTPERNQPGNAVQAVDALVQAKQIGSAQPPHRLVSRVISLEGMSPNDVLLRADMLHRDAGLLSESRPGAGRVKDVGRAFHTATVVQTNA